MKKKSLTKSTRKFIRFEKARIRREISDSKKQGELIQQLYEKVLIEKSNKRQDKV